MIPSFLRWFNGRLGSAWLILGKGPTFDRRHELDLSSYYKLGLNHVCLHESCDLAHFTDLEAAIDCVYSLTNPDVSVIMPLYPHLLNRPGKLSLDELCAHHSGLEALRSRGRLFTYNSSLSRKKANHLPSITVRYFSAVAGVNLLAAAGVKKMRTIGVDGGTAYGRKFDQANRLANGRKSFNIQFEEISKSVNKHRIDFAPLLK